MSWDRALLYVFVVLSHDRRKIDHVNVTKHPTAEWTAHQRVVAFPGHEAMPRYLHRDRDQIYGAAFRRKVKAIGLKEVISARRSPWQNPFCERVLGTLRRECTDHVIALGERHLSRVLQEYIEYYNESRCHLSLEGNAPELRLVDGGAGEVVVIGKTSV